MTTDEIGAQAPDPATIDQGGEPFADERVDGDVAPSVDSATSSPAVDRSTAPKPTILGDYLDRDTVASIYASVSLIDSWRATEQSRADYPDDPDMAKRKAGQLVFLYAAQRLGIAAQDVTFEAFMATIRQDDFVDVMAAYRGKSTAS